MKKLFVGVLLLAVGCAPVSQKEDRVAELEIKLTRLEQKQEDIEKDVEKTNERIDKLTELISELRLEIEKIKLKLITGETDTTQIKTPPKPTMHGGAMHQKDFPDVHKPPAVVGEQKTEDTDTEATEEDAEAAYKKATELYSVKKLYEARDYFLNFIKKFPENKFTDNAFFWIGKIYHELGDSNRAEEIYKSLVDKCEKGKLPDCNKLPDAYLQLMKLYMERGDISQANEYYSILIERFPTSDAAVRAREQKVLMGE